MSEPRFRDDRRGMERLPIRLVIALVVGVASLSVMMSMLSSISGLAVTELDVQSEPEVVGPGDHTVAVIVVDPGGRGVAGATIVARGGSARLEEVETAMTGGNGTAKLALSPELAANRRDGTVEFDVKPPAGMEYADERENTALLVVEPQ